MDTRKYAYIAAAQARGWHFADSCMLRGRRPSDLDMKKMLDSAMEYAKDEAAGSREVFNKKAAISAFRMAFQDHPRVP